MSQKQHGLKRNLVMSGKFWEQVWDFKLQHNNLNMIHKYKIGGLKAEKWNPNRVSKRKIE